VKLQARHLEEISLGLNDVEHEIQHTLFRCANDPHCQMISVQFMMDCTHPELMNSPANCKANPKCQVTADKKCTFKDSSHDAHQLELCTYSDTERFLAEPVAPLEEGELPEPIFYFKHHVVEGTNHGGGAAMSLGNPYSIYKMDLSNAPDWVTGMEEIKEKLQEECTCDRGSTGAGNCNTFKEEGMKQRRFWCYINPAKVPACVLGQRLNVYTASGDRGRTTFWTEDLCHKQCQCSGLGQYPHHGTKLSSEVREDMLWPNLMNYGESCHMWSQADKDLGKNWCFVGFDSTCPDRWISNSGDIHATHDDDLSPPVLTEGRRAEVKGIVKQFKSRLAVDSRGGSKYCGNFGKKDLVKATSLCREVSWPAAILSLLDLVLKLPMLLILWKFLANRCMDELPVEENYDIVWSDDEDNIFDDPSGSASKSYAESESSYSSGRDSADRQKKDDNAGSSGGGWLFGKKKDS